MNESVVTPGLDEFRILAKERRVIPVVRRLLADGETPVGVYRKLAADRPGTFLLESAEHGGVWSRYSFIGARSAAVLSERDGQAVWYGDPPVGLPSGGDPWQALRGTLEALHSERLPGLPPLTGGMVGFVSYDAVRRLECLPETTTDDLELPDMAFLLATDVAVLDHDNGTVLLVANAVNWDDRDERVDDAWRDAVERLDRMTAEMAVPTPSSVAAFEPDTPVQHNSATPKADFLASVERAKEDIRAGEAFQIVVSQRFESTTRAEPVDVYRVLRRDNPSPYMYLLRLPGPDGGDDGAYSVVGSSPEALVKVEGDRVLTRPIAGTRWRGETPEDDAALSDELLADPKERAEHLMLVDLSRNDLGRVCAAGSVEVVDFMTVRRYSHVMHIESTVVGRLRPDLRAVDVLAACFPAGTLSGAPKVRAMEIIDDLETTRRGLYGGVVGYLDFSGDLDVAIAIRTALIQDGVAYVQAGGGIVADSDAEAEWNESRNKAAAALRAIAVAESIRPVVPG